MEIGAKLKDARSRSGLTQEYVAEAVQVSRQTISNWENERSYPDIVSVIKLSDLYNISLDELLKGDEKMIGHLEESTNIVNSNRRLITAVAVPDPVRPVQRPDRPQHLPDRGQHRRRRDQYVHPVLPNHFEIIGG